MNVVNICTCSDHRPAPSSDPWPEQVPQLAGLVKQAPVAVACLVRDPAPRQAAVLAAAFCAGAAASVSDVSCEVCFCTC